MNITEYIEQNMDKTSCNIVVPYHEFAKEVGLKDLRDLRTVKEWIESDLQELHKCRYIKHNAIGKIESSLIHELWISNTVVIIDFSHWIWQLRAANPHWLSDILKQTRMNNYIVRGE